MEVGAAASLHEDLFEGYEPRVLEKIFQRAPRAVHRLTKLLASEEYVRGERIRARLFTGKPGSEKTTTAISIAHQLQDKWLFKQIKCSKFIKRGRGSSAEALRKKIGLFTSPLFANVANGKMGSLILLDEIDTLTWHAGDSNYDTAEATKVLGALFSGENLHSMAFFILTSNNPQTISEDLKSRLIGRTIEFEGIRGAEDARSAVLEHMARRGMSKLHHRCDSKFLAEQYQSEGLKDWSGRDFETLAEIIFEMSLANDSAGEFEVTQDHIKGAIKEIKRSKETLAEGKAEKTSAQESREQHDTAMKLQKEQHEEAMRQQSRQHQQSFWSSLGSMALTAVGTVVVVVGFIVQMGESSEEREARLRREEGYRDRRRSHRAFNANIVSVHYSKI